MGFYDIKTINTAIATTLATATSVNRAEDLADITENIPEMDMPLIMVYHDEGDYVGSNSDTQQNTFGGNNNSIKHRDWTFICDLYVGRYALFGQTMVLAAEVTQEMIDIFDSQPANAPFGMDEISSFQYNWARIELIYSNVSYLGTRFTIPIRIN